MAVITVLGASGYTGRLLAAALDARGVDFVAAGRERAKVEAAVAGLGHAVDVRTVDVTDRASLDELAGSSDVVATTVGPFTDLGGPVLEAAIAGGCHYLDSTGEQNFIRWALDDQGTAARSAGVTAVPACGLDYLPGDTLASLAARAVGAPVREVHVVYLARGGGIMLSRGTRRTIARMIGEPSVAFVDGEYAEESIGDVRRHAWFPRPVGPRNAAGFPGGEPLFVPRHVPSVRTVRSYLAMPGGLAEGAKLVTTLGRFRPASRIIRSVLTAGPEGPSADDRRRQRWACIAEAVGEDGALARAWAYGRDIYGLTGHAMAAVAERLADGRSQAVGVVSPAEALDAEELLDDLADAADLWWSVRA